MGPDPIAFCRERLPALYDQAVATLEERGRNGDDKARARLAEAQREPIASLVAFAGPGGGELYLLAGRDGLSVSDQAPVQAPAFYALRMPSAVARHAIERVERGEIAPGRAAEALSILAGHKARQLFGATSYAFRLEVSDAPVVGTVVLDLSLGRGDLPTEPEFRLTVAYDELEDARELGIGPHQLFLSGKIRIDGDAAKAMMLGMTLAQLR